MKSHQEDKDQIPPVSTTIESTDKKTDVKKKRSPNWLPLEEEQLAISWINVSERPEFAANQTGEMFYKQVEEDFNRYSKLHYRDFNQIRIRWTALNTATLKFSSIYNAIARNPPSGTNHDDWLKTAMTVYQEQSKGSAFTSLAAWEKVRFAPKWRSENKNETILKNLEPSSDTFEDASDTTSILTPTSRSASMIARPIGQKAAKRRRLEENSEMNDEKLMQANEFNTISKDRLASFNEGNVILKEQNKISDARLKLEEKKLELEEKKLIIEQEYRQSETQMNDLKMLREAEDDSHDAETREVLLLMKQKIKRKWLSSGLS